MARISVTFAHVLTLLALLVYGYAFLESLPFWFHPGWTTDDALQQVFPFHAVYHPEVFKGDIIAETMTGYLAPVQYWLSYLFTLIFVEPIVASHYVMLVQYIVTLSFLFLAVRHVSSTPAGFFAVMWFIHTREVMQRMTGGIPRGWAPAVFASFFYFVLKNNHKGVLVVLLFGCISHPPATVICAVCYGSYLLYAYSKRTEQSSFLKPLLLLILLSPVYTLIAYKVVERPDEIGQMVGPTEAKTMPQLQRPDGRFPFLPVLPAVQEIRMYGFQPFVGRLYNPGRFAKRAIRVGVIASFCLLLIYGVVNKKRGVPIQVLIFFLSTLFVYFLSRQLVFKLYVPDRHILFPFTFFLIIFFTVGLWRLFHLDKENNFKRAEFGVAKWSLLALITLGTLFFIGSGTGLYGDGNFNYSSTKKGRVFLWARKHTPKTSLIAGHPTFIDGLQLFGARRAYATTETYHPFYKGYLNIIEPRILTSFKAHYARDLTELVEILDPVGVDYFIFEKRRFYPDMLMEESYFEPLRSEVEALTRRHYTEYAYKQLPRSVDPQNHPYMPFRDDKAAVVDVQKLKRYLAHD